MSEDVDRYRRLRAVFEEALQCEPSARDAYLDGACAADPALRPAVVRLLAAHGEAGSFLESGPALSTPTAANLDDFRGTERFEIRRRLGAGGMGAVYEVHDRARDEIVALKTILRASPADIYRLKREFRGLADVAHPNFVCLYELFVTADQCFFTMELVDGVSFVDYARGPDDRRFVDRLLSAYRQLVDGVSHLHRVGKLHRDIKPSNVLVTPQGRVVILDFGLTTERCSDSVDDSGHIMGTPAYLSPEEAAGSQPSEASDWYGVGVTLYEALTGDVPFKGAPLDVLARKKAMDPPVPASVAPDVPADLSSMCLSMIARDPAARVSGPAALDRLGFLRRDALRSDTRVAPPADTPFVGRRRELALLDEALSELAARRPAAVFVCGPSGIGKTSLVKAFLSGLSAREDTVVLSGRCYEHESVPYKALDGVIDNLSRFLISLPVAVTQSLLPTGVVALPRLFPVLLRVPAIAQACRDRTPDTADPFLLRRTAFGVLREVLARMSNRWRVVITSDDFQWADSDGAQLLEELLRPPGAPVVLTVVAFRSEEVPGNPVLRRVVEGGCANAWSPLVVGPMHEADARTLVNVLFQSDSALDDGRKLRITREARGSPFVLEQLARHVAITRADPSLEPTFSQMFDRELETLSSDARCFVQTLAICGRPMAPELIFRACGVAREKQFLMTKLRASRFVRSSGSSQQVETYHDRIRDVVVDRIPPDEVRRIHGLIARSLVQMNAGDCEALYEHYSGAGDGENASVQAGLAAVKAATALAFDRAAAFYRRALTLAPLSASAQAWREELAAALANAGRPAEAADAYLEAAARAPSAQRAELQRRGAEQFLIGGHIERGLNLIRTELARMGIDVPDSPRAALPRILWRRAQLRWRGLDFTPRTAADIDAEALLRVDTCWSATTGLALVDMIGASHFSARHLLMALDAGEPSRIACAMAFESAARAAYPTGRKLGERLVQRANVLARMAAHPNAIVLSMLAEGVAAMAVGRWRKALTVSEHAQTYLREQCVGLTWELNLAQNLMVWALMYLGELAELSRQVPALLLAARSRENLYLATELCTRANLCWLAADDPDGGEREAIASIERWTHEGCHRQHYSAMLARLQTALYRGDADAAWGLLPEHESILRRSCLDRVQVIRIEALYMRARCALAMTCSTGGTRPFSSAARAAIRRLGRERMPWSDPIARMLTAAVSHLEGDTALAVRHLRDAVEGFDRAEMKLYAAVARRRLGALKNDAAGRECLRQADEWMAAEEIKNPEAMTRMLAPGFANPS
jgi:serine/threonine protein kinase